MGLKNITQAPPGSVSQFATLKVGDVDGGDYTEIEADGTVVNYGNATTWTDELGSLLTQRIESPASKIVLNIAEGSTDFKDTADLTDYVVLSLQINHPWELLTPIEPHFHWWQAQAAIPNWLMAYRWQVNGEAKTESWTQAKYEGNVFTYESGTLNQITDFPLITPPAGAGLSDIVQIRFHRDNNNDSTLFTGNDPVSGNVGTMSFDVHKKDNTGGSREEYEK